MSENSKIEWCDHTFNPWEGCAPVGPGCDNCYAEARNQRFGGGIAINWGPGAPRRRTSAGNWRMPLKWNAKAQAAHAAWETGVKSVAGGDEDELLAQGFIKLARPRVFCASLADVFDNEVPDKWRADLFALIHATPYLDWLLLTKRIGNARSLRDQYAAAGVPFLFKQWGEWNQRHDMHANQQEVAGKLWHTFDPDTSVCRVGKKAAGRCLDGREHNGFPGGAAP
jgi:protein gp37